MLPTPPRRIVIGAEYHAGLAAGLAAARPDLEVRGNRAALITADDLAWGECYIGFRRPPLPTLGSVRWVHCTGAGVDGWLHPAPLPDGVLLTRTSESYGAPIAEWAVARALAFTQQLRALDEAQREARWAQREVPMLAGSRVLVVGAGDIGSHCARAFRALGCHVTGVSRSGTVRGDRDAASPFDAMARVEGLAALLPEARIVVVTLPLTRDTQGLLSRDLLACCRGAYLLNAGRGAVVEEGGIPEALDAGWLAGAALDVFTVEPLPAASPLWRHPRVMISPHISGLTTVPGAVEGFLQALAELERGVLPRWTVDQSRGY
ncbi:MAG: D-2-hydroxyacid dehydrogenase [Gemmatimonadetes bacterium]|nr:D-2-hydroxyacid dehydrogenase [Gemmatimonadota bacterium]